MIKRSKQNLDALRLALALFMIIAVIGATVSYSIYESLKSMDRLDRSVVIDHFYATKQSAVDGGEMIRGWLPSFLPDASTDIHMRNIADQNDIWARISLDESALADFLRNKEPTPVSDVVLPRTPNQLGAGPVSWWPQDLVWPGLTISESYTYYRASAFANSPVDRVGGGSFVAVPKEGGCLYYWDNE